MKKVSKCIVKAALLSLTKAGAQDCEIFFTRQVNESKDKIYLATPEIENVSFLKIISAGYTTYYLTVKNTGRSVKAPLKGVSLLLGDHSKIDRPDIPVTINVNKNRTFEKGKYLFSSYFSLSLEEINRLAASGITKFKLYTSHYSRSKQEKQSGRISVIVAIAACLKSVGVACYVQLVRDEIYGCQLKYYRRFNLMQD